MIPALVLGFLFGMTLIAGMADIPLRRAKHARTVRAWTDARGLEPNASGEVVTRVHGVPVALRFDADSVRAAARYVFGSGPRFRLRARYPERGPEPLSPEALADEVRRRHRRADDADQVVDRVTRAIASELHAPMHAPSFSSDGREVVVQLTGLSHDAHALEGALAIAAVLASYDLDRLAPLAGALSSTVEVGDDGLAFVASPRRVPIRITLEEGRTAPFTRLLGRIEDTAPELVRVAVEVTRATRASMLGEGTRAAESLRALVDMREARVLLRPREIEVLFVGHPPPHRLVDAAEAMESILVAPQESPFR